MKKTWISTFSFIFLVVTATAWTAPAPDKGAPYNNYKNIGYSVQDLTTAESLDIDKKLIISIMANEQDEKIIVSSGNPVSIIVYLKPGEEKGILADWWLATETPLGWYSLTSNGWTPGVNSLATTPLFNIIPQVEIFNGYLPVGNYTFYFIVDTIPNGALDLQLYLDYVQVQVINARSF